MADRKRTKAEARSLKMMAEELSEEYMFFEQIGRFRSLVPEGWHTVRLTAPVRPKRVKVTLRLDEDMVRWFRHIGFGYQARMNAVLRAYMHAVLAKYVEEEGDRAIDGTPI